MNARYSKMDPDTITPLSDVFIPEKDFNNSAKQFFNNCFHIINVHTEMDPLLGEFIAAVKQYTGYLAVAVRLVDKDASVSYKQYDGFNQGFIHLANPLTLNSTRSECIRVMTKSPKCGNESYTPGGSFYTTSKSQFLKSGCGNTANSPCIACSEFGYESIALIPIRLGGRIIGLIHIADPRKKNISQELIENLEEAALGLGTAIRRIRLSERLSEYTDGINSLIQTGADAHLVIVMLQDSNEIEGLHVFFNDEWPHLTGYNREELYRMSFFDLVAKNDREAFLSRHRNRMAGECISGLFETTIDLKDGTSIPVELTSRASCFRKKKAEIAYIRNISARKLAYHSLKESETRFRSIFHSSPLALSLWDTRGVLVDENQISKDIFGVEGEGRQGFNIFSDPMIPDLVKTSLSQKRIADCELLYDFDQVEKLNLYTTSRKGKVDIKLGITELQQKRDGLGGYLIYAADISIQKKMERSIEASEKLYRTLFETTGTATIIVDSEGIIQLANREWYQLLGYTKGQIESNVSLFGMVIPRDRPKVINHFKLAQNDLNSTRSSYECRLIDSNGITLTVIANFSMIPGTRQQVFSFVNISNLKAMTQEIRKSERRLRLLSQKLLAAQEDERARIARDLHDDLVQELAAIKIRSMVLGSKLESTSIGIKARELAEMAESAIRSAHRISINLRPEMLDKLGLIGAIQWYGEDFERRNGISCPIDIIKNGDQIHISKTIETAAYRIVQESLTNVLRHSNATEVGVYVKLTDKDLTIKVADNGTGIDKAKLASDSSLGILGMRERTFAAGGKFKIASRPGKGTRVSVILPIS